MSRLTVTRIDAAAQQMRQLAMAEGCSPDELETVVVSPESMRKADARLLLMLHHRGTPRLVAKLARGETDSGLVMEYSVLQRLRGHHPTIPALLAKAEGGFILRHVNQRCYPDVVRSLRRHRSELVALLEFLVREMVGMHRALPASSSGGLREACRAHFGEHVEPGDLADLGQLQIGTCHGDLGPWNVCVGWPARAAAFLDWEDFKPAGFPAFDVLNLLLTTGLLTGDHPEGAPFESMFDNLFHPGSVFWSPFVCGLQAYAAATGLPFVLLLRVVPAFLQAMLFRLSSHGRSDAGFFYAPLRRSFLEHLPRLEKLSVES